MKMKIQLISLLFIQRLLLPKDFYFLFYFLWIQFLTALVSRIGAMILGGES